MIGLANGQSIPKSTLFSIDGKIIDRDTGNIILDFRNEKNSIVLDTARLSNGQFHFSGKTNRACEALLFTDPAVHDVDDSTVLRFLIEPKNMFISYNRNDARHPLISGSALQAEKERWDTIKSPLLGQEEYWFQTAKVLAKRYATSHTPSLQDEINRTQHSRDSINRSIRALDLTYIEEHPNSYLSGYLLFQQERKLPLDTAEVLYNNLAGEVKRSSFGKSVLSYIYPLTDDDSFRRANPLISDQFDRHLRGLHSIHQLSLKDSSGKTISLNSYKGKYILVDFWSSWCKPCIENIPALNRLIGNYKSAPIQFISISLDKDDDRWKQAIIKHHFTGVQLSDTSGFSGLSAVFCKVLWVPTYVIADQNGQIIKYDAPWPAGPQLKKLLDELIRQNRSSSNQ
jgi:thiol-disulfide isomerase/thioredoxin